MKQGSLVEYVTPAVTDYGTLVEMTSAAHLIMGAASVHDLSFSSPQTPGGSGEPIGGGTSAGTITEIADPGSGNTSPTGGGAPGGGVDPGGGTSAGGASGGGASGGGGGKLPFTGFEAGVVAAIGSAFAAGGGALRRALRRRGPS
jgi:hypothetical protein